MSPNYCPKCGKPVPTGSLFCPNCGAKIEAQETSASLENVNMAEKAAKLAEAERRAKEEAAEEKRRRQENKKTWQYKSKASANITLIFAVISILVGVALILPGLFLENSAFLLIGKICFFVAIGVFIADVVFIIITILKQFNGEYKGFQNAVPYISIVPAIFMVVAFFMYIPHVSVASYYFDKDGGAYYALTDNKYIVKGLAGNKEDIVIKSYIDGKIVDTVASGSFKNTSIKSVTFENGTSLTIEGEAFAYCKYLSFVDFGDGRFLVKKDAFKDDNLLNDFDINAAEIKDDAKFAEYSTSDASILPDSVDRVVTVNGGKYEKVYDNAKTYIVSGDVTLNGSAYNKFLVNENLVLEPGFTFNKSRIFAQKVYTDWFNLKYTHIPFAKNIYIPTSVTSIPADFFGDELGAYKSLSIYYEGTAEQWAQITVDTTSGNANYTNNNYTITYATTFNA